MTITAISRDWGVDPAIVRIATTDDLNTISTEGYILNQDSIIKQLNNGEFQWTSSDLILVSYSGGWGFFSYDPITGSLVSVATNPNLLNFASVPITAAQFNGMYATPIQLVAAPEANQLLVFDRLQLVMTYNTAAYAAGGAAAVQFDSTANGAGVSASTTIAAASFQATASTTFNFNPGVVVEPFTTTVGKGLYLSNITAAFTTGDSQMVANIWYKTITVS